MEGGSLGAVLHWGSRRTQSRLCQTLGRAGGGQANLVECPHLGSRLPAAGGTRGAAAEVWVG